MEQLWAEYVAAIPVSSKWTIRVGRACRARTHSRVARLSVASPLFKGIQERHKRSLPGVLGDHLRLVTTNGASVALARHCRRTR
jgi:hypothetical protein